MSKTFRKFLGWAMLILPVVIVLALDMYARGHTPIVVIIGTYVLVAVIVAFILIALEFIGITK